MAKKSGINDDVILAYALKNAVEHGGEAQIGSVISGLFAEGLKKETIRDVMVKVKDAVREVNNMDIELQKAKLSRLENLIGHRKIKKEGELPELPRVGRKGVIMRFAPSPSGALHVGHAMTACLSFLYVQKYRGKFYIRIEDTNPENIYPPAYELIRKDSEFLFKKKARIMIQSDRLMTYYNYAEKLICKKAAYVCTCSQAKFRKLAEKRKACPCRQISAGENIRRWKKMLAKKGGYGEGGAVLRFKSSISDPNPAMRDFPLARICLAKHPKQGAKYRVWPLMNFSVAVDDIEQGMTHIIRAKEHRDNAKRQKMIFLALGAGKKYPWTAFLGRYKFKDLELSATKITQEIKSGKYKGWDDSRLPTIASLKKRGYKPEAFWKMAGQRGISEVDKVISQKDFFELLSRFNAEAEKTKEKQTAVRILK